jgi:hypothetical protein
MHLDYPQQQMGDRILGSEGQRFGQRFFGGGNPRGSIVRKEYCRDGIVRLTTTCRAAAQLG